MSDFTETLGICIRHTLIHYHSSLVQGNVVAFSFLLTCQALRIQMKDFLTLLLIFYCFYFNSLLFVYCLYVFHTNPVTLFRYGRAGEGQGTGNTGKEAKEIGHRHT